MKVTALFPPLLSSQWHTWWHLWWLWWWRRKPRYCESSSWWNWNWNLWKGMNVLFSQLEIFSLPFVSLNCFRFSFMLGCMFLIFVWKVNYTCLQHILYVLSQKFDNTHFFSFSLFNIDGQSSISSPKLTICLYFKGYNLWWRDWTATQSFRSRLIKKAIIFCLL